MFNNAYEFRNEVREYGIISQRAIALKKNNSGKVRAICANSDYEWLV